MKKQKAQTEIRWCGLTKGDAISTYDSRFKGVDPNARYYQDPNTGLWYIEASAKKTSTTEPPVKSAERPAEKMETTVCMVLELFDKTGRLKQRNTTKDGVPVKIEYFNKEAQ